ncbi:kinetochore-associated Ndc80 complex subunit spc25 [Agyrium rufum]|nr:kinetochore-associated Ndc80 complex subunit spc25 [Agyrium rufum]
MATMLEPSLSSSQYRAPYSTTSAPTMADTLPIIDFNFDDLRSRMAKFTTRFDAFIVQGRKRVLEERSNFRMKVTELEEEQRSKARDIETLTQRTQSHAQTLSKEAAEASEMRTAIAAITQQRDAHLSHRDRLKSEMAALQKSINQRLAAQRQHAVRMEAQARLNEPELRFWEECLGMRIEGAGEADRLRFVFAHIDERDWAREGWFELDMSRVDYRVGAIKPRVEADRLEEEVQKLNRTRDLAMFLKGMRGLIGEAM